MDKKLSYAFIVASLILIAGSASAIEPTVGDVYKELQKGDIQAARVLATEVVKAHPDSAEAHYAMSKVMIDYDSSSNASNLTGKFYARERPYFETAKKEFETAKLLQPGLSFVSVSDAAEFQARIESELANEVKEPGTVEYLVKYGLMFIAFLFAILCTFHVMMRSALTG